MSTQSRTMGTVLLAMLLIILLGVLGVALNNTEPQVHEHELTPADLVRDGDDLLKMGLQAFHDHRTPIMADVLLDAAQDYALVLQAFCVTDADQEPCKSGINTFWTVIAEVGDYYNELE